MEFLWIIILSVFQQNALLYFKCWKIALSLIITNFVHCWVSDFSLPPERGDKFLIPCFATLQFPLIIMLWLKFHLMLFSFFTLKEVRFRTGALVSSYNFYGIWSACFSPGCFCKNCGQLQITNCLNQWYYASKCNNYF